MLNQTRFTTESQGTRKMILVDEQNSTAFSCVIGNTGVTANAEGKKIIKAGTPITGNLLSRNTAFTLATTTSGSSNAIGVAHHDVDVTDGDANGGVIVFGFIDISKLDTDVQALITSEVKTALNMIKFVK